jgi:excisionase family DNA binding protein
MLILVVIAFYLVDYTRLKCNQQHHAEHLGVVMTTVEKKSVGMSVAEAAAEAGVSESTIYQLFHTGQLPFARRLGHRIVIHRERFSDWLAGESVHQRA